MTSADTGTSWTGTGEITFSGTSTLHEWAGKVTARPFKTMVTYDANGEPFRIQAEVEVESSLMDTAEPKRDANMRKAMKVTDYPLIRATVDAPVAGIATDGKTPVKLPMTLMLLGKPQTVEAGISHWKMAGRKATFDLNFDVSMKASGISVPPVLVFIRVGDAVTVHASVTLTQD